MADENKPVAITPRVHKPKIKKEKSTQNESKDKTSTGVVRKSKHAGRTDHREEEQEQKPKKKHVKKPCNNKEKEKQKKKDCNDNECIIPTPKPYCEESKIVGKGLAALQAAIAIGNLNATGQAFATIGRIFGGLNGFLGPVESILAANTIFDVVVEAKLSRNKTLIPFVQNFAAAGVSLVVAVLQFLGIGLGDFVVALKVTKAALLVVLKIVYRIFRVRSCPKTITELKGVLDAGLVLLMLSNVIYTLIASVPPPNQTLPVMKITPLPTSSAIAIPTTTTTTPLPPMTSASFQVKLKKTPTFTSAQQVADWITRELPAYVDDIIATH